MQCCEYGPRFGIRKISYNHLTNILKARVSYLNKVNLKDLLTLSIRLPLQNIDHKKFERHFVNVFPDTDRHNLQFGQISQSVLEWQAFPSWCYVTLQIIGPIHKLQRKCNVVNTVPSLIFTKFLTTILQSLLKQVCLILTKVCPKYLLTLSIR